jgi:hypothetical protein
VTDSDEEFERIVQVDALINKFAQSPKIEPQDVSTLLDSLHSIKGLVDFENESLWQVFDKLSPHLIGFTNLEQLSELARVSFEMELPYQVFWASMVNVLLISHQEFSVGGEKASLIDFTYYITRALASALR